MTKIKQIIQLEGQRRNNHIQMREQLRKGLAKMQQQEQKLLAQFGVQNYQELMLKDPTAQGMIDEAHKAHQMAGQWDEVLTRQLKEGIEVTIDLSEIEATINELNDTINELNNLFNVSSD